MKAVSKHSTRVIPHYVITPYITTMLKVVPFFVLPMLFGVEFDL